MRWKREREEKRNENRKMREKREREKQEKEGRKSEEGNWTAGPSVCQQHKKNVSCKWRFAFFSLFLPKKGREKKNILISLSFSESLFGKSFVVFHQSVLLLARQKYQASN